ncbi:nuclear transport factor 2 family protein [Sphingomonas sp. LB3N6]|uniref:nuclear transport factor 2 family protein n=1 Tax=Sphingomonas fucosidasi TaxID=3096164 RepID=UPI002FC5E556
MSIEHACERLIRRFALLNDAHDHDAIAAMFTEDGSFARPTDPDNPVRGQDAIRAFFRDRPKRETRHVIANTVVDVESPTAARAVSYVVLYTGEQGKTTLVGEFVDTLSQDMAGTWRLASRTGSLAFTGHTT